MTKTEERESVVLENQGQKIFGIMHRPCVATPYPAILMCHGLGGHKAGKYRLYVILAEKLSRIGIGSLRIDFRGSGDSEGDFCDMTLSGEVGDAVKAIEYLRNRTDVDTNRLGVFGRSVGGAVGIMAAEQAGCIKSLATWAPLFDGDQWVEQWKHLQKKEISEEHRKENMRINGQVPGYGFFKQLFTMHMEEHLKHLDNIPMLHIHGEQDDVVTVHHAERYWDVRSKAKGKNKFIRLQKSDHDFSHSKEQLLAVDETVDWFAQTL